MRRSPTATFLAFTGEAPLKLDLSRNGVKLGPAFLAFTGEAPLKHENPVVHGGKNVPFLAFTGEAPLKLPKAGLAPAASRVLSSPSPARPH